MYRNQLGTAFIKGGSPFNSISFEMDPPTLFILFGGGEGRKVGREENVQQLELSNDLSRPRYVRAKQTCHTCET